MPCFETNIEIPAKYIEPIYEHVHHANIIRLLEQARLEFLDSLGCSMQWFLEQGLHLVIAGIEIHYSRELKGGIIKCTCEKPVIKSRCILIDQKIYLSNGNEAVEARVNSMVYSPKLQRSVTAPTEFIHKISNLPKN